MWQDISLSSYSYIKEQGMGPYSQWRHDTQHNDIQHNNIPHNDTQRNDTQHNDSQHNDTQHNDIPHNNKQNVTLSITAFTLMSE